MLPATDSYSEEEADFFSELLVQQVRVVSALSSRSC